MKLPKRKLKRRRLLPPAEKEAGKTAAPQAAAPAVAVARKAVKVAAEAPRMSLKPKTASAPEPTQEASTQAGRTTQPPRQAPWPNAQQRKANPTSEDTHLERLSKQGWQDCTAVSESSRQVKQSWRKVVASHLKIFRLQVLRRRRRREKSTTFSRLLI